VIEMKIPIDEVKGEAISIVNSTNTAVAAQSGTLQVFGTPFMIALMEKATCVAIADHLDDGETTVGTNVEISHVKASRVGAVITATATLDDVDGRKLTFSVVAKEEDGATIGEGSIERFVVLSDKFMKKVESK
jgi:predicted thioesterase